MNLTKLYSSIKRASTLNVVLLIALTMLFVFLLIYEIYNEYEQKGFEQISQASHSVAHLEQEKYTIKSIIIRTALAIATLSFIIFAIFFALNKLFLATLHRDIDRFLEFFKAALDRDASIDPDEIHFEDFKKMVHYANEMIDRVRSQKQSLEELNESLEERVLLKTKKLRDERNFSQDLLRRQKEFLRYTVHETNTPLSVILTSLELYTMKMPKDRHLSKIEVASKNIFSLYDDLSFLIKKDHINYKKSHIHLGDFVASRVEFFDEVARINELNFDLVVPKEDLFIYFSDAKLMRLVDNTLSNAIKYTPAQNTITVRIAKEVQGVLFLVSSKSKSIEDTKRLFEQFYRESSEVDGFGIGLSLVKSICVEEGVEVSVDSDETQTSFRYEFV